MLKSMQFLMRTCPSHLGQPSNSSRFLHCVDFLFRFIAFPRPLEPPRVPAASYLLWRSANRTRPATLIPGKEAKLGHTPLNIWVTRTCLYHGMQ